MLTGRESAAELGRQIRAALRPQPRCPGCGRFVKRHAVFCSSACGHRTFQKENPPARKGGQIGAQPCPMTQ